jgi:hypothetical protein
VVFGGGETRGETWRDVERMPGSSGRAMRVEEDIEEDGSSREEGQEERATTGAPAATELVTTEGCRRRRGTG